MNPKHVHPSQPEGIPPGRPGRKLGPIDAGVGASHRLWLEALRTRLSRSGLTISDLSERSGWSKSKISELLRGTGLYPRWEITCSLLHILGVPTWPVRRLWAAAAREAQKKPEWIDNCIQGVALHVGPDTPPVDHRAFAEMHRPAYTAYARTFLRSDAQARQTVEEAFDALWLRWDEALTSSDVVKFAWQVLRRSVMARTPRVDGRPELVGAAFGTVALSQKGAPAERFAQFEESVTLFAAVSRLPAHQLDVVVLKHMRGMSDAAVADVLGVPVVAVSSADHYAQQHLTTALRSERPQKGPPSDSDH